MAEAMEPVVPGSGNDTVEHDPLTEPADTTIPFTRWVMAASLLALNLVDVLVTKLIIEQGGSEMNPVMRPIIHDRRPLLVKMMVATLVGVLLLACPRTSKFPDRAARWHWW